MGNIHYGWTCLTLWRVEHSGEAPVAIVSLVSKQWSYSDYSISLIQPVDDRYRLLYGGQPYTIFLDLRIPDSPSNHDMGLYCRTRYILLLNFSTAPSGGGGK
jgi:hypothetical protein